MSAIDRPIFLIGTGRCGSSLLYRLLTYHPSLTWQSHYTSYLPGGGSWAALHHIHRLPGLSQLLSSAPPKWIPQPTENYRLLNAATDGVFTSPRALTADDMTPQAARRLRAMVTQHLRASGKRRFALKHTGYPRAAYLLAAFPDAQFIHVKRDGRSVAASLCKVGWWSGEGHWGWGPLTDEERAAYLDSDRHELVLADLYWRILMRHLDEGLRAVPDGQLLELRYDDLVAHTPEVMDRIRTFCDLPASDLFRERVLATPMTSDDTRWRQTLTVEEQALIEDLLTPDLRAWGFEGTP